MGYSLGLDIGVASVGWGIVNHDGDIIGAGSYLFQEADKKNTAETRGFRSARRTRRRKTHRLQRGRKLFISAGLIQKEDVIICPKGITPYHLRFKGLSERLSSDELVIALRHLLKYRGLPDFSLNCSSDEKSEKSTKLILNENEKQLQSGKYVCDILLDRLEGDSEDGISTVRGLHNRFFTKDIVKEASTLLEKQREYHLCIDTGFIKNYLEILQSRRAYYEGPGKGSVWGWDGDQKEWMERMRGHCTYFENELCLVKAAPTAELFNILNDLNNFTIDGEHLSYEQKALLIETVFQKNKDNSKLEKILKALSIDREHDIRGCRINKNGVEIFSSFAGYREITDALKSVNSELNCNDFDVLDEIAIVLSTFQTKDSCKAELLRIGFPDMESEILSSILEKPNHPFKGTHSLSKKAIFCILDDLWHTNKNQMQLFSEKGIQPAYQFTIHGKQINPSLANALYVSSVTRRAVSQTFTLFNDLTQKYGVFDSITIEMAREKNSKDKKEFIEKMQSEGEKINIHVHDVLNEANLSWRGKLFEKVKLYFLQDGKCIYTQQTIKIDQLLAHPDDYEVDHIIPLSISFDDSLHNKVLTTRTINQKKGQRTPYEYLSEEQFHKMSIFVQNLVEKAQSKGDDFSGLRMTKKKKNNLLFKQDITRWDVQRQFINRNLNDTRYASREVLSILNSYCKENELRTKVKTVNGSYTSFLRKRWGIHKDRSVDFSHHAIDAIIIALSPYTLSLLSTVRRYDMHPELDEVVDLSTGEKIMDEDLISAIYQFKSIGNQIERYSFIHYSHKVDKKKNRSLSDDTLVSTRFVGDKELLVRRIKDLYSKDPSTQNTIVRCFTKNEEKLLAFHKDPETYQILKQVFEQYYDPEKKTNPFALYFAATGQYVCKFTKKQVQIPIKSLKYYDNGAPTSAIDISKKQGVRKNKRVLLTQLTPYQMDVFSDGKQYKFISIKHVDLKNGRVPANIYDFMKEKKGIDETFVFLFSLWKNDLFELNGEIYRFCGVNTDETNRIEYKLIHKESNQQLRSCIGKSTVSFHKRNFDSIGSIL